MELLSLMMAANLAVGLMIGVTGLGFLLPMFYLLAVSMTSAQAMAFSFCAFILSGILSAVTFGRKRALDLRIGTWMSLGSIAGTLAGVSINLMLPPALAAKTLYAMVLISGISILVPGKRGQTAENGFFRSWSGSRIAACVLIGLVTGCICSIGGAGGPILTIPILTALGMPIHTVIGTAMYNSIFISLIAFPRYLKAAGGMQIPYLSCLPILLVLYGAGVLIGSRYSFRINQTRLKRIIAVLCTAVAAVKLAGQ